jgi:hypothetical protein
MTRPAFWSVADEAAMSALIAIVSHTPLWAIGLFGVLLVFGLQALRPRSMPVPRLFLLPALFMAWGIVSLVQRAGGAPLPCIDWLVLAGVGLAIGWRTTSWSSARLEAEDNRITLPGSKAPLIRNLAIFLVKYVLNVAFVVMPASHAAIALLDIAVSGLSAGYFAAWMLSFIAWYRGSPRVTAPAVLDSR